MFAWNVPFTSILVPPAFPVLTAALLALESDRKFGPHARLRRAQRVVALPFFGIIPVFSRKPLSGHLPMIGATIAITMRSAVVWAHHVFATGAVLLPFFSLVSFLIAMPTGIRFFAWIGTKHGGSLSFETPMHQHDQAVAGDLSEQERPVVGERCAQPLPGAVVHGQPRVDRVREPLPRPAQAAPDAPPDGPPPCSRHPRYPIGRGRRGVSRWAGRR